jgi:hypothetical protein
MVSLAVPYGRILGFLDRSHYFFFSSSSSLVLHEAEWTPFQTHYFSENLVAPGIAIHFYQISKQNFDPQAFHKKQENLRTELV